ncbi:hypothetical protein F2K62_002453 [Vibrio fluvialis]|nr:hypothetical protein [Vibrio fluvialis]
MIVIKPSKFLVGIYIASPLFMFICLSHLLLKGAFREQPLFLFSFLLVIWGVSCFLTFSCLGLVSRLGFKSDSNGLQLGSQEPIPWSEIQRVETNGYSGRFGGIRVYFKDNIYYHLPWWKKPINSHQIYHRDFHTGTLYFKSAEEIVEQIKLGKR